MVRAILAEQRQHGRCESKREDTYQHLKPANAVPYYGDQLTQLGILLASAEASPETGTEKPR